MSAHTQFYLNDTWTPDVDGLGYTHLRDALVDTAVQAQPPFSVAVYGGWGSGKTSLLRAVMCRLGGDLTQIAPEDALLDKKYEEDARLKTLWKKIAKGTKHEMHCVWFNPWQHQHEAHPMIALLHEIRHSFSIRLKALDAAKKAGYVALKTGLRLLDDLGATVSKALVGHAVSLGIDKIEATGKAYEQERFLNLMDSQRFQLHFETAIAHLVGNETPDQERRLVIFIDDLDRCESGPLFKLLESIKLYLATRKCVFYFGLDPNHTETALKGAGLNNEHQARAYLHKLFQMSVHLPRARDLKPFIHQKLKELKAADYFEACPDLADQLAEMLEANPRRIKNFLNQLMLRGRAYKTRTQKPADPRLLSLLLALRIYYPDVYSAMEEEPAALPNILQGMLTTRPNEGDSGLKATVARITHLPQMEQASTEADSTFTAATSDHYTDALGLFWVLSRFKKKFIHTFTDFEIQTLEEYLAP